jgi:hypothetical protein
MSEQKWFSAKQLFLHTPNDKRIKQWYEERIVLIRAATDDEAWEKAKAEGKEYSDFGDDSCRFIEIVDLFKLFEEPGDMKEVYSIKNISSLKPDEYIFRFYPDSPADCEENGEKHCWFNHDGRTSGCYNCQVIGEGELWRTEDE